MYAWLLSGIHSHKEKTLRIEVERDNKRIPLNGGESTAIMFAFVLSFVIAWYAGGFIGECTVRVVRKIIEQAEKREACKECEEKEIPIDLEQYASHQDRERGHRHASQEKPGKEEKPGNQ